MYEIYVVKEGDTIEGIASLYGIDPAILYQINNFPPEYYPAQGSNIIVPRRQDANFNYYTIKKGDSLYQIANNYGIDVSTLARINGLNMNDYIYPNQTIIVPRQGVKLYWTIENETLSEVAQKLNTTVDQLLKNNKSIYLQSEQLIIYRESI